MKNEMLLKELKEIKARVDILIHRLETEDAAVVTTVGEVRKFAILEEVCRLGGKATPQQISDLARKYGRDPSACGGYYGGKTASMKADPTRQFRELTDAGKKTVEDTRAAWGKDWLDRVPMEIVGSQYAADTEISF